MTDHDDRNPPGTWQADEASSMSRTSSTATGYGSTSEHGGRVQDDLKRDAAELARNAKEQGRSMFEQQKHTVARQVESVGSAFRSAAGELQGEGESQAGRYVAMLAEKLESLGEQLRHKNMDGLVREAESFGRRAPATFFAGTMVAGFMLTRFLKSSAQRPHREAGSRSWQEDPVSGPMSASSGAAASAASSPMGPSMDASSSGFGTTDRTLGTGVAGDEAPLRDSGEGPSLYREPRWGESIPAGSGMSGPSAATSTSTGVTQPGGNIHGNR